MEFPELEKKYHNFYAPAFEIEVAGENIMEKGVEIVSVTVDNTLNNADHFTFTVNNAYDVVLRELKWLDELFTFGNKVQVKMGYADQQRVMLIGLITEV